MVLSFLEFELFHSFRWGTLYRGLELKLWRNVRKNKKHPSDCPIDFCALLSGNVFLSEAERERERDRQTDRETKTKRDKQTNRNMQSKEREINEDIDEYAYCIPNPVATLVHQGKGTKYPR